MLTGGRIWRPPHTRKSGPACSASRQNLWYVYTAFLLCSIFALCVCCWFYLNFSLHCETQIYEILREANQASQEEMWLFSFGARECPSDMLLEHTSLSRRPNAIATNLSALYVLQEFASLLVLCQNGLLSVQSVFFSSLASLPTLVDCILRKLRGFLMVISVDSVKRELLEEYTPKCSKSSSSKQSSGSTKRKHKGKSGNMKKPTPEAKSDRNINLSAKVHIFCSIHRLFYFHSSRLGT